MPDGSPPDLTPVDDARVSDALRQATRQISGVEGYSAQEELSTLSSNTVFTGIDVYEDSIFAGSEGYSAPATIYVELNFGTGKSRTPMGASFPARVRFKMDDEKAVVTDITADTSNFERGT